LRQEDKNMRRQPGVPRLTADHIEQRKALRESLVDQSPPPGWVKRTTPNGPIYIRRVDGLRALVSDHEDPDGRKRLISLSRPDRRPTNEDVREVGTLFRGGFAGPALLSDSRNCPDLIFLEFGVPVANDVSTIGAWLAEPRGVGELLTAVSYDLDFAGEDGLMLTIMGAYAVAREMAEGWSRPPSDRLNRLIGTLGEALARYLPHEQRAEILAVSGETLLKILAEEYPRECWPPRGRESAEVECVRAMLLVASGRRELSSRVAEAATGVVAARPEYLALGHDEAWQRADRALGEKLRAVLLVVLKNFAA
jgi:hypothetical protein